MEGINVLILSIGVMEAFVRGEHRDLVEYILISSMAPVSQPYHLFNPKKGISSLHFELNGWVRNAFGEKYIAYGTFGSFMLGSPASTEHY